MIAIDRSLCIGCGNCLDKCPCRSISIEDDKAVYHPEKGCIKCMHCGAACPCEAITYDGGPTVTGEDLPEFSIDFPNELENLIKSRRSYRIFTDEMVPMEEIEHALDVASWAPSAKNQHPTKYYLIRGSEEVRKVTKLIMDDIREKQDERLELLKAYEEGNNKVFGTASTAILAYARCNAVNPQTDTAIKMATAELVLQSRGFGTCWSGYLMRSLNSIKALKEIFSVPENNMFFACLLVGYPAEKYCHIPERIKRADIKSADWGNSEA
ncbi:MAG: nitroreductase family protein [Firmicutes bacterium]|nr:nitroreductase family protein [Bacillota bacterium]